MVWAPRESALSTLEPSSVVPEPIALRRSELVRHEVLEKPSEPECASIVSVSYLRLLTHLGTLLRYTGNQQ